MDPVTIMLLFGAGMSLVSGFARADSATREASANALELERSARQADAARLDAIRRGSLAEGRRRLEVGRVMAAQRVGFAAAGVDTTTGTPAAVADASERMGELDALTIRANALREAFGHQEAARGLRMRAQNVRERGEAEAFNAYAGGASEAAQKGVQVYTSKKG